MIKVSEIDTLLNGLSAVNPVGSPASVQKHVPASPKRGPEFENIFEHTLRDTQPVTFSSHAQNRLLHRQISLSDPQMARLEKGVSSAADKGGESSLVLLDNLAFIVSVRNRTVVTALDQSQTGSHVFTQIDSAVIA